MFRKSKFNTKINFRDREEGHSFSFTTTCLNEQTLMEILRNQYEKFGMLVIDYISQNGEEIHVATKNAVQWEFQEDRIEEIHQLVKDYIKNRAINMEAHAVFVNGELKGVFAKYSLAELKRRNLISNGVSANEIVVKPIQINSFKDFDIRNDHRETNTSNSFEISSAIET